MKLTKMLPLLLLLVPSFAFGAVDLSMQNLVQMVVFLIVFGIIIGLLFLLVAKAPFIPAEWKQWINYFIWFIVILVAINFLLSLAGMPLFTLR